jgi:cytochrome c biogenesis protein CcmG/thiol:disulfide interchange protein DsbE
LQPCPVGTAAQRAQLPTTRLHCLGPGAPSLALDHLPAGPYVVNFWASWCEPCQREEPRLAAAATAMRGRVAFLGIDTQDDRDSALKFLQRFGIDYPQLFDPDGDVLYRLPARGLPVTVAINAAGRVVYRRLGEISTAQLAAALKAADPTPPSGSGTG